MLKNEIAIINGPNLNLIGKREPTFYGDLSMNKYFLKLIEKPYLKNITLSYTQSNHEGEIIESLHEKEGSVLGIVLNAGAFTHTSLAIADAIRSISVPIVEVHITNTSKREKYRQLSFISSVSKGSICGFGMFSYELAIISFII
ncbi:3-dehydroquinate dehydratase [Candidatus Uzinura diaspidicola str. ASNER]|uniref:3-dehydroquinate dehydratase n=1 Tax=Candidatus Uzinura diaspidicola str. ASNER TaxID=1133592 RepID=L7VK56_9FLAO|nr:3-dehydroquinate dehydratase [Candidatus Uzinura diaspidicola str. ASNER]